MVCLFLPKIQFQGTLCMWEEDLDFCVKIILKNGSM